jgi:hypothetical protein
MAIFSHFFIEKANLTNKKCQFVLTLGKYIWLDLQ